MACKMLFILPFLFPVRNVLSTSAMDVLRSGVTNWLECAVDQHPSDCLEGRTVRQIREMTGDVKKEVLQDMILSRRIGKQVAEDSSELSPEDLEEVRRLETQNEDIMEKIRSKDGKPNGLLDEISDLFTYGMVKLLGYFSPEKHGDEEVAEKIVQEEEGKNQVEGRGHKKKYLKKQNKHLKLILLIMLFKNKVKMFVQKFQLLLTLKFLLISFVNMAANVIRLWIELKKHKPHKVVYYENAHHQHHYDHEHVHDHDYSYPGSHSHHSHHEEEYGGPWPWSRSYIEKQSEQAFQSLNSQNKRPNGAAHNVVYLKQRPLR